MNNKEFTKKYYINRTSSNSIKWENAKEKGYLPMWIADMDFKDDERIINSLKEFIEFGDYGYTNLPKDYYDTFIKWQKDRHNLEIKKDWIRFSKGANDAMFHIIYALTNEKDNIMINPPLYPPFAKNILATGRKVVTSKLISSNGYFTFDYKDIEKKFKTKKIKMFMLCSPHNPIGRVWKQGELEELFALCKKYNVIVMSDEVHSDIIMPDQTYIPSLALKKYQNNVVTISAVSKTFSLAIYSHSHIICPNNTFRRKIDEYQNKHHLEKPNAFNCLPTYYGYKYGAEWLDQVNNVIFENYQYIKTKLPELETTNLEGSYLLFVNLKKYNKERSAATCLMKNCHIFANAGETFGKGYNNWVRLNLATSKTNIIKAVKEIKAFINK